MFHSGSKVLVTGSGAGFRILKSHHMFLEGSIKFIRLAASSLQAFSFNFRSSGVMLVLVLKFSFSGSQLSKRRDCDVKNRLCTSLWMSLLVLSIVKDVSLLGQLGGAEAQSAVFRWLSKQQMSHFTGCVRQGCADTGVICRGGTRVV